jgi:hypothetical protein
MKHCGDVERALGLASLGSGLLAAFVLSISVGANYWLLTDEPWAMSGTGDQASASASGGDPPRYEC